tara:strand:+ start:7418 stop:7576 length:159 start_codon:yes stop_codon:yes gene_type:complete
MNQDNYIKELENIIEIAINCLDDIITTQANSSKYRSIAKDSLEKILHKRSTH